MRENYCVDSTTKNRSFVSVSEELRKRGVENNDFMLALFDPRLKGVNPYHPNLRSEIKSAIRKECEINPWYFLREVYRIDEDTPFMLNLGTCAQAWCYFNNIDSWLCLPRQRGATTNLLALGTWSILFDPEFFRISFAGRTRQMSDILFGKFFRRVSYIPEYLINRSIISTDTSHLSVYHVVIIGDESGRTLTITDEAEYRPFPLSIADFERPAIDANYDHKQLYCSTPADLASPMATAWVAHFLQYTVRWKEKFYDMTPLEFGDYIKLLYPKHCGTVYIEYGLIDLGVSLKDAIKLLYLLPDTKAFRREGLLQRFDSSKIEEMERLLKNLYNVSKGEE